MNARRASALPKRHLEMLALFQELGPEAHLSAADVYEHLRKRLPGVGLATVHRGLGRLASAGELMRLDLPEAEAALYELAQEPHAHFRCNACTMVQDVPYQLPEAEQRQLEAQLGGKLLGASITFCGLCAPCAASAGLSL